MTVETSMRNASLEDLATLLKEQHEAKVDVVVRADQLRSEDGNLIVPGVTTEIVDDGVNAAPGTMRPTAVCDETLADKFGIPIRYLRSVRDSGLSVPNVATVSDRAVEMDAKLVDCMLNAHFAADDRKVLVRGFKANGDGVGIARAVLSDGYRAIDHLDSLMAVLDGARRVSGDVQVDKIDLSERYMRVYFVAPQISELAPTLLEHYRSPFGDGGVQRIRDLAAREGMGYEPGKEPIVYAGFVASNSETGGGAFTLVPRLWVKICANGLVIKADAFRQVHAGQKLDEGLVRWSEATRKASIDLLAQQTKDTVATFLDVEYMAAKIRDIEEAAGVPVTKPDETIKLVAARLKYTQAEQETLLAHFIGGGQATAGGILNAATSMAQTVEDPDRAAEIEDSALDALAIAAGQR